MLAALLCSENFAVLPRDHGVGQGAAALAPVLETVQIQVNDRRNVERQQLGHDQAADYGDAERPPGFTACSIAKSDRESAEQSRHGRHHDGPEALDTTFKDRLFGRFTLLALRFKGKDANTLRDTFQ